jgi:hypothetical protein
MNIIHPMCVISKFKIVLIKISKIECYNVPFPNLRLWILYFWVSNKCFGAFKNSQSFQLLNYHIDTKY